MTTLDIYTSKMYRVRVKVRHGRKHGLPRGRVRLLSPHEAPRCKRCCKLTGTPQGFGSPKNDEALRPPVEARLKDLVRAEALAYGTVE